MIFYFFILHFAHCYRINGLYSMLGEVGSWNSSWTEVSESVHGLAEKMPCLEHTSASVAAGCIDSNAGKD